MKLLNNVSIDAKVELFKRLKKWVEHGNIKDLNQLHKILSDYEVKGISSNAVPDCLPSFVKVGEKIHLTRGESEWEYTGEVIAVWYKNTQYTCPQIMSDLSHVVFGTDSIYYLTIAEEARPKIYDRIVLNTNEKGILIIPFINGVNIERME